MSKTIAQGVEMGRPSLLQAEAEKKDGVVTATYIGGRCVPVMSGTIDLELRKSHSESDRARIRTIAGIRTLPDRDRRSSRARRRS
jgi:hypothetical protein